MITEVISILVVLLSGTSTEPCIEKRLPQWFLHLGTRDGANKDIINSRTSPGLIDQQSWTDLSTEEYLHREVVKRSPLPLVLLGDQYYYFGIYFKTNYYKANEFCRAHGMNLLSIETEAENSLILKYWKQNLKKVDHIYTSGSDLGEEGNFIWLSTGKPLNFTYWSPPQPDNAGKNEHCVEIWKLAENNYFWNDIPCTASYYFICELPKCSSFCIT
ncbi:hypothetical protein HHI36_022416 [Cryptolaemus montrouzieri]|uniref:C-type lectin domain-containing protein n=1 Tax=Cryptolaemus montrouzieri TaxID=559131 RepID=A0ABD2N0W3_9CUCU